MEPLRSSPPQGRSRATSAEDDRQGRVEQPTCVNGDRPQIVVLNFIDMVNFS